ncbi:MAG: Endolytic murein transglycosylase [Ferruginibacter sp.]|nr:Endolytic murein transglycosylase [Ferruginibacter sp.]
MKKFVRLFILLLLIVAAWAAWNFFGPVVHSPEGKYFYIPTGSDYATVKQKLLAENIIPNGFFFERVAKQVNYNSNIKPGRYEINGGNILSLVRMLKSGNQSPVKLVINKLRTKEDLAGKIAANFETDSLTAIRFLTSNDSLRSYHLDSNTAMTAIIPNTYLLQWNSSFKKLFARLYSEQEKFWTPERKQKAAAKKLTTAQVYTMASIVEEETNKAEDKGLVASVYMNRINNGMKLEADPTVKYAMRNFGLKRILHGHLAYPSDFNTYQHTGLPPGPICTPSSKTIDAVLDAPETNYIFFVAKPDFKGYSNFASTYAEHLVFAKAYQRALDSLIISKQTNKP